MMKLPTARGAIAAIATAGIATLAAHPELPDELRAIGITVIATTGIVCVMVQNAVGSVFTHKAPPTLVDDAHPPTADRLAGLQQQAQGLQE